MPAQAKSGECHCSCSGWKTSRKSQASRHRKYSQNPVTALSCCNDLTAAQNPVANRRGSYWALAALHINRPWGRDPPASRRVIDRCLRSVARTPSIATNFNHGVKTCWILLEPMFDDALNVGVIQKPCTWRFCKDHAHCLLYGCRTLVGIA